MGTAFPLTKLSGNGVLTREIFLLLLLISYFHCYHVTAFRASQTMSNLEIRICKALAH